MADGYTPIAELIAGAADPFAVCIDQYGRQPNAFWREVLGMQPDPWQAEANRALAHGHTRLSIRSGHGVGKSTWAAGSMCWFANTRAPFKIGVTAPSAPQLFDALWAEARVVFNRLPPAWRDLWDIEESRIKLKAAPDECFITARTARADKPEALQGLHSKNLMLLVDEASGVDQAVFEAAGGSMSTAGAITMLTGNPTRNTGFSGARIIWNAIAGGPAVSAVWRARASRRISSAKSPSATARIPTTTGFACWVNFRWPRMTR